MPEHFCNSCDQRHDLPLSSNPKCLRQSKMSQKAHLCLSNAIMQCKAEMEPIRVDDECKSVSHLDLTPHPEFDDQTIAQLIALFPNLTSITFDGSAKAGRRSLTAVSKCYHLKELFLLNCHQIEGDDLKEAITEIKLVTLGLSHRAIDEALWSTIQKIPLKNLSLTKIEWELQALTVDSLKNLNSLELCTERGLCKAGLVDFLEQLKELEICKLTSSKIVKADVLGALTTALRSLDLSWSENLKDEDLSDLVASCPKLRALTLARCKHLTDRALKWLSKLHDLTELDLSHCKLMTGAALRAFIQNHGTLKSFNCIGCSVDHSLLLSNQSFDQILHLALPSHFDVSWFIGSSLPHLKDLEMANNPSLDDEGIEKLLPTLMASSVERLNIVGCCLSSRAFAKLAELQSLKTLCLGGRIGVPLLLNEDDFSQLMRFKHLETLHITLAQNIDSSTLKDLIKSCSALKRIEIGPLLNLSLVDLEQLRAFFPHLVLHHYGYQNIPDFLKGMFFSKKEPAAKSQGAI